jgi:hypothetical protein
VKREPIRRRTPLRRTAGLATRTALKRTAPLKRTTPLARGPVSAASAAQQRKVLGRPCLVCGARAPVDPAHLVPRSLGGCDHADCVVALCRGHHRAYDRGDLDLVPHLEPAHRREAAHAVEHLGLIGALRRLTGSRHAEAMVVVERGGGRPD